MEVATENNQLEKIVSESSLSKSESQILLEKFSNYFAIADEWSKKIKEIKVTDVSQVAEMKMNREARLMLKSKRLEIESTRKELKEESLRKGQTIDSIAKILKNLIEPLENECEQNEKFKEIKEAQEKAERQAMRIEKLLPYNVAFDANVIGSMNDEMFDNYFNGVVKSHNDKIEAERKAEEERLAAIEAERKRQEEIAKENARLKAEAEAKEKAFAVERAKAESERKKAEEKAKKEREAIEAKAKAEREEQEKKAAAERKIVEAKLAKEKSEREMVQAELKAKQDAELKAKQLAEEKAKAEKLAAEKAAKAPIKKQLTTWVDSFSIGKPLSENSTTQLIESKFEAFRVWAKTQVDAL